MNRVLLTGKLTNDFLKRSDKLATCGIAVSKDYGSGVEFIDLVAFNTMVEAVKDLKKGDLVFVEGAWSSQKNGDRKYVQVVVNKVELLVSKKKEQVEDEQMVEDDLPMNADDIQVGDDDLPF